MQLSRPATLASGAGILAAGLAGAVATVSWQVAHALVHPRRLALWRQPGDLGLAHDEVCIRTPDGLALAAWLIRGRTDAAVVLSHGQARNRADLLGVARVLNRHGYTLLLLDHRACGESQGQIESFGVGESTDVIAGATFLAGLAGVSPSRIGALGWSMGAAAALLATGRSPAIRAVIADSSFACLELLVGEKFHLLTRLPPFPFAPVLVRCAEWQAGISRRDARPLDAMPLIAPRPVLLIHGRDDATIPLHHAARLVEAGDDRVETWFPEGVDHVGASEADADEYEARVVDFFDRALRG